MIAFREVIMLGRGRGCAVAVWVGARGKVVGSENFLFPNLDGAYTDVYLCKRSQ